MRIVKHNIKKVSVLCDMCGNENYSIVAEGREHEFDNTTDDIFHVVKCDKCGFFYLNPIPDISELSVIYPSNYYCYADNRVGDKGRKSILRYFKGFLVDRFGFPNAIKKLIRDYFKDASYISVLDVWCGNGMALDVFKSIKGKTAETHGVDFNDDAVRVSKNKGHIVYKDVFENVCLPENSFDIVYSSNVIEHVASPNKFMHKVALLLKPGGIFLCETPNIDSFEAKLFARSGNWGGYHFPRHWSFFTDESIKCLGVQNGLSVEDIRYQPVPIFWIWTFHSLVFNLTHSKKIADFFFPLLENNINYIYSLLLKINFTIWDYCIYFLTRKTSFLGITFRK